MTCPSNYHCHKAIPWLGDVPTHWPIMRAKWLFHKTERPVRAKDEVVTCFRDGVVTIRKNRRELGFTESLREIGYQGIRRGDLVIHSMDAFAGAIGVADSDGKGTPVYSVCKPEPQVNAYYYAHLLREMARNQWIQALAKGIRERSSDFRYADFAQQRVPFPPLNEQVAIVHYLEQIDRHIRRFVNAKERLIRLLKEEKRAVIHRAVTRGLDPNVPLKPSGVEWLGDIPAHWELRRLKSLCSMQSGVGITADSIESAGKFPVYGGNGLRGYASHYTHEGEFALIGRQGALCGNVHIARGRFWASEHAVVSTLHSGQVVEWFGAILRAMNLNQYSIAAAQPGLAVERVLHLRVPVPSSEEQSVIAKRIEDRTAAIDEAIRHASDQIGLLREYHTRLIADVVTGKLDVREAGHTSVNATDAIGQQAGEYRNESHQIPRSEFSQHR